MSTVTVELVGGPADGVAFPLDDSLCDLWENRLPAFIVVEGHQAVAHWETPIPEPVGARYRPTRKLARDTGRLIYEWSTLR